MNIVVGAKFTLSTIFSFSGFHFLLATTTRNMRLRHVQEFKNIVVLVYLLNNYYSPHFRVDRRIFTYSIAL